MLGVNILILLTLLLYIYTGRRLKWHLHNVRNVLGTIQDEHLGMIADNSQLRSENAILQASLEQTIALYDVTKQICKTLDENTLFDIFSEQIRKYVSLDDCKFLKGEADLSGYSDYLILPLEIENKSVGYLAASGVKDGQKDEFFILAHQFMLGIKRVFLYRKVQEMAITDSLTGAFTRRFHLDRFNEEVERSKKFHYSFSFLMLDIDHFKEYNDKYGHLVGDAILKEVAGTIKESIRQVDSVGRYGGEEFLIILTETDKNGARFAAERIRQAVETKRIRVYDEDLKATVSIGIATFPEDADETQLLIEKADKSLYRAKQTGRNRICVHGIYR